jgi:transcriptional regulator with XRE-family HTH domain
MDYSFVKIQQKRVGHFLADLRFNKHLTQQDVANAIKLPRTQIARIESGEYNVGSEHLILYANYLGCPLFKATSFIEPQDLQVGNFVALDVGAKEPLPDVFEVEDIAKYIGGTGVEFQNVFMKRYPEPTKDGMIRATVREITELRPIRLTIKWLVAFGFKNGDTQVWDYVADINSFSLWNEGTEDDEPQFFLRTQGRMRKRVEFVHELQNLFSQKRNGEKLGLLHPPYGVE